MVPPHDPAVYEDQKNVYIESMAELEKTFLAFDSIMYTARFGARYHRMRDPRFTPGNKNYRAHGILAYVPEQLKALMCAFVTMDRYYRTDFNMVLSFSA